MNLQETRDYFFNLHDVECNQKYNKILPYSFHLSLVEKQAYKFIHLIEGDTNQWNVLKSALGHDSIEDARVSYNDIKQLFGFEVAEIIYLCTENKGRNRLARKSKEFYQELATNDLAVYVKLCDIIANSLFSLTTNSSMFNKYKQEYEDKVYSLLYKDKYAEMFSFLNKLYEL